MTRTPAAGFSACATAQTTDCVESAFGMTFDQDECLLDGSDASLLYPFVVGCLRNTLNYSTTNCGPAKQVYLNVLLDMNADGDWLDSFAGCDAYGTPGCIHEWAVVNAPVQLAADGCEARVTPQFAVGNSGGPCWLRLSLSPTPAPPDFPWAGTASLPGGQIACGETEDYPIDIVAPPLPARRASWGEMKLVYR